MVATARRIFDAYEPAQPTRIVLTKLDEAASLSPLMGLLRERQLPISYLGTGQHVPRRPESRDCAASGRLGTWRVEAVGSFPVMTQDSAQKPRGAILAVTSGKGGRWQALNVVINLAVSLARLGHRVGILDADFGLGNIDVLLGLTPVYHLGHLLTGERQLEEIVLEGRSASRSFLPGPASARSTALTANQWSRLEAALKRRSRARAGFPADRHRGRHLRQRRRAADAGRARVIVVTSFEPTAVVDAYAMVKIVTTASPSATDLGIVINSGRDADESALVFRQLDIASSRFLNRGLRYYGFVVHDPAVRDAVLAHRPIVDHMPQSPASRCFSHPGVADCRLRSATGPGLRLADRSISHSPSVGTDPGQIGTPRCA